MEGVTVNLVKVNPKETLQMHLKFMKRLLPKKEHSAGQSIKKQCLYYCRCRYAATNSKEFDK